MIGRNFNFQIIFRIVLIVLLSLIAGFLLASGQSGSIVFLCIALFIIVFFNLINYLNATNRKISYFLESVQNEDSMLTFPTNITDKKCLIEVLSGFSKKSTPHFRRCLWASTNSSCIKGIYLFWG